MVRGADGIESCTLDIPRPAKLGHVIVDDADHAIIVMDAAAP